MMVAPGANTAPLLTAAGATKVAWAGATTAAAAAGAAEMDPALADIVPR